MKIPASILGLMAASAMSGCVANAPPAETCVDANTGDPPPVDASASSGAEDEAENEGYAEDEGATEHDSPDTPVDGDFGGEHWCPLCGIG